MHRRLAANSRMNYIDYFFDASRPLIKPRFVATEDEWEHICRVFPEPGFRSYFLGHIVAKLSKELKQNGINTYLDRNREQRFASLPEFLSNIQLTGKADSGYVGRGTDGTRDEAAHRAGGSAGNAGTTQREAQGGEGEKSESET